ncbi:hypothetical protein [Aquabacterium sp. OR-4]|uniref:hypothetical protein n=1 Tax=Aquabacterium sp. OR-4 TaxID=2978127 RepID=UPI0028C9C3FD|nr:hypothetical protein [Aquabacterium sp. OR-4]MDT7836985.1 hypothetical protein [Aquabacterium sp. OR-4]
MNRLLHKGLLRAAAMATVLQAGGLPAAWAQMAPPVPPEVLAAARLNPRIGAGEQWVVERDTALQSLGIAAGGAVVAPPGRSLSMTVDGVETTLRPGRYRGAVQLRVTEAHPVRFSDLHVHPFRQALYIDAGGVVQGKSVPSAAGPAWKLENGVLSGAQLRSAGENFNGLLVAGGDVTARGLTLDFSGNGGNDFAGYGAGVMSHGKTTRLVIDGADLRTHGAVRTAVVCDGGSTLVVKNSRVTSLTGQLPADYVSNVSPGEMKDAPWMLGITGNVRSTNVLGDDTTCSYVNSTLSADGWGVLSIDASQNARLTTINSQVLLTGARGYGSYAIGNSSNRFYGTVFHVPTHGAIVTGGTVEFAASRPDTLARLNGELKLGLSPAELAALKPAETVVNSQRFGVMMWGDAVVSVRDGTQFNTGEAVFLNKGATSRIEVDGRGGVQLNARNGVLFQAIDNDDPGPVMVDGLMANTGVYREPAKAPAKVPGFDLAAVHATDMQARFTHSQLKGDFFNAIGLRLLGSEMGPGGPPGPDAKPPTPSGANLVLTLDNSQLEGVVTASRARHFVDSIGPAQVDELARVRNTPAPAINNGVIVSLKASRWTVTGPSHLTALELAADAELRAPAGQRLVLRVDGQVRPIQPGRIAGQILLQPEAL